MEKYTYDAIKAVKIFDGRNGKLLALGEILLNRRS
jgi:hypothetical protein